MLHHQNSEPRNEVVKLFYDYVKFMFVTPEDRYLFEDRLRSLLAY